LREQFSVYVWFFAAADPFHLVFFLGFPRQSKSAAAHPFVDVWP
jgi:hypothetical protein